MWFNLTASLCSSSWSSCTIITFPIGELVIEICDIYESKLSVITLLVFFHKHWRKRKVSERVWVSVKLLELDQTWINDTFRGVPARGESKERGPWWCERIQTPVQLVNIHILGGPHVAEQGIACKLRQRWISWAHIGLTLCLMQWSFKDTFCCDIAFVTFLKKRQ